MMRNNNLDFSRYETPTSKFISELGLKGGYINFSNSGKGGEKKYFTLSLESFIMILKDIDNNYDSFYGHENYVEKEWRDLGSRFYSDAPSNAMSTVQTKPLFATLSKIIMWANSPNLDKLDPEQNINLSKEIIQNTIFKLSELSDNYSHKQQSIIAHSSLMEETIIIENTSIRDFAKDLFIYFYNNDWSNIINNTIQKPSSINNNNFISHDFYNFKRLLAEFKSPQTKESLTSSSTQRYFVTPIYQDNDKLYYFTTQWNSKGDYDLTFDNLKLFFESQFLNFKLKKIDNKFLLIEETYKRISKIDFNYNSFYQYTLDSGLIFSPQLIKRFIASLCTKPFVICSGLSGSGKTKLAQAFALWICESEEQYKIIPVGADWTNREPLLGYPNALEANKYVTPENGALDLINRARLDITKPYFLILDEMNLSHVERYFADFLSTMESGDAIPLHTIDSEETREGGIPKQIKLPNNLFIIGTVNIDETTYMFSPKVLDRANTIEFRLTEKDLEDFIASDIKLDMDLLKGEGAIMGESFVNMAIQKTDKNLSAVEKDLMKFFKELKKSGAEFGYRTASEIGRLMFMLELLGEKSDNLLDIAIMQKLLPKLHGSRNKLTKVLPILGSFCLSKDGEKIKENYLDRFTNNSFTEEELKNDKNIKYPISFEKICRMYKNAIENGFASYAEA